MADLLMAALGSNTRDHLLWLWRAGASATSPDDGGALSEASIRAVQLLHLMGDQELDNLEGQVCLTTAWDPNGIRDICTSSHHSSG